MSPDRKNGFTLIELLIVVGVVTMLAAVGVPNYIQYRYKAGIDTDAEQMIAVLREAISKAKSGAEGARWTFYVDTVNEWYAIQKAPTSTPTYLNKTYLNPSVTFSTTTNINQYWFHQSPNITVATSSMVIGLTTQGGRFTDTITMDTLGRITRESNY